MVLDIRVQDGSKKFFVKIKVRTIMCVKNPNNLVWNCFQNWDDNCV